MIAQRTTSNTQEPSQLAVSCVLIGLLQLANFGKSSMRTSSTTTRRVPLALGCSQMA